MANKNDRRDIPGMARAQVQSFWGQEKVFDKWERALREFFPKMKVWKKGNDLDVLCPFHNEDTPSFKISPRKRVAKCFGCGKSFTNPITMLLEMGRVMKRPLTVLQICQALNVHLSVPIGKKDLKQLEDYKANQDVKKDFFRLCHEELVRDYEQGGKKYAGTLEYLEGRGVDLHFLRQYSIGVIPPDKDWRAPALRHHSLVDEVHKYFHKLRNPIYKGCLIFPYNIGPGEISRLKVRIPNNHSTFTPDITDKFLLADSYDDDIGVYGMDMVLSDLDSECKDPEVIVVEGEFDCLTYFSHALKNGLVSPFVIATGGTNNFNLDRLKGIFNDLHWINIAGDNDYPNRGGFNFTNNLMRNSEKYSIRIFDWSSLKGRKDFDEVVVKDGIKKLYSCITDPNSFLKPADWALDSIKDDLKNADDNKHIENLLGDMFSSLKSSHTEFKRFLRLAGDIVGEDFSHVLKACLRETRPLRGEAFLDDLKEAFLSEYKIIGVGTDTSANKLHLWHMHNKGEREIEIGSSASVRNNLTQDLGSLYSWSEDEVGIPNHLKVVQKAKEIDYKTLPELEKIVSDHLNLVIQDLSRKAPTMSGLTILSDGIHWRKIKGRPCLVIVCRSGFFSMEFDEEGKNTIKMLDNPLYGDCLLRPDPLEDNSWEEFRGVSDIKGHINTDLKGLFDKLKDIFDLGWSFKYRSSSAYLAALALYFTVHPIFRRQVYTIINAEAESGKTNLTGGIFSGDQVETLKLLSLGKFSKGDLTHAGWKDLFSFKGLINVVDEFELSGASDDKRGIECRKMLDYLRSNFLRSKSSGAQGTAGGGKRKQLKVCCPTILSGIKPLSGEARDLSRFNVIALQKEEGRELSVEEQVFTKYSRDDLETLRKQLTVSLWPHIPKILSSVSQVEKKFVSSNLGVRIVNQRFKESLLPLLTIMEYVGFDSVPWFLEFVGDNESHLARMKSGSECDRLMEDLLNQPFRATNPESGQTQDLTISFFLRTARNREFLNKSESGVHFLDSDMTLVIDWSKARNIIFKNLKKYEKQDSAALSQVMQGHKNYKGDGSIMRTSKLRTLLGQVSVNAHSISILDLSSEINKFNEPRDQSSNGGPYKSPTFKDSESSA